MLSSKDKHLTFSQEKYLAFRLTGTKYSGQEYTPTHTSSYCVYWIKTETCTDEERSQGLQNLPTK